jgi:hypothetical protein
MAEAKAEDQPRYSRGALERIRDEIRAQKLEPSGCLHG